jgi:hypothetical protein
VVQGEALSHHPGRETAVETDAETNKAADGHQLMGDAFGPLPGRGDNIDESGLQEHSNWAQRGCEGDSGGSG